MRAITKERKMAIDKKLTDSEFLMSLWSTKTHTLVMAWGEFGPT